MAIKLITLDMDGTSYEPMGEIVQENIEPIKKAISMGVKVVFVTGRPIFAKMNKIKEHGFMQEQSIMIGCNGAVVYDFNTDQVLHKTSIPKDVVKKTFEILSKPEYKEVEAWAYSDDFEQAYVNMEVKTSKILKIENLFFDKEVILVKPGQEFKDCFKFLIYNFDEKLKKELNELGLAMYHPANHFIAEVNYKNVNKKSAVEYLSNLWYIKPDEIMAMGDGANDVPMMEFVGLSVAPNNAVEEVKKVSKVILDESWDKGAVKVAIEKYVLKGE